MKLIALAAVFVALFAVAGAVFWGLQSSTRNILLKDVVAAPVSDSERSLRVFLKIENSGSPDVLLSASSPDAGNTELFSPEADGGVPIPAQSMPSLAADGAHIVLQQVDGDLSEGRIIPLTLEFRDARKVTTKATVAAPITTGHASHTGLFGIGHVLQVGDGEPAPLLSIRAEENRESPGWRIYIDTTEFTFSEKQADGAHVHGVGHGHLYVNGLKIGRVYGGVAEVGALPPGEHVVRVTLNTNDHRAYVVDGEPVTATTTIAASRN